MAMTRKRLRVIVGDQSLVRDDTCGVHDDNTEMISESGRAGPPTSRRGDVERLPHRQGFVGGEEPLPNGRGSERDLSRRWDVRVAERFEDSLDLRQRFGLVEVFGVIESAQRLEGVPAGGMLGG